MTTRTLCEYNYYIDIEKHYLYDYIVNTVSTPH